MSENLPTPPPPKDRGPLWLGFFIAWAALIGGYVVAISLMSAGASMGAAGSDGFFILLGLAPWLLIVGLIIWFAGKGKTQIAKGIAIGLAAIVAILLLLAAACFTLLSSTSFH